MSKHAKHFQYVAMILAGAVLMTGCSGRRTDSYEKVPTADSFSVQDQTALYEEFPQEKVLYLTVGRDLEGKDGYTWQQINRTDLSGQRESKEKAYECQALVQFGNEEGPTSRDFGFGDVASNATVRLSGTKASEKPQKSYRIKINSGSGSVSGIKTFMLLKGFSDPYRFISKLSYDLMAEAEDMLSVRTGFVHLYVRDETQDQDALFVDYGLYTMVESVNKKYLKNRDLDKSGELYKIRDFDFSRKEDVIMQPTEADFDEEAFEEFLEAKGSNDYDRLLAMLDAVNDESRDIDELVGYYFDEDNLYTWMAFNILMDNKATDTENFYLYAPTGSERFYIIPWDPDRSLRESYEELTDPGYEPGWEQGIYLYTESKLFGRMMQDERCINKLTERIDKLHSGVLSGSHVQQKAEMLAETVKPYLYALPDMTFARVTEKNYDKLVAGISQRMDANYYAYFDSIETPAPFHIHEPKKEGENVVISWDPSHILSGDITYDLTLSDSWDFENQLKTETDLADTKVSLGKLSPGQYFVKVTAKSGEKAQQAYEFYNTEKKTTVRGVMCFYVLEDGSTSASLF
ncbi:MAG: CotH kinase family protein [Lachnospiraceae bacterium]|nr:CotH kinase family protein [Lachnospiraceae bacterium]